MNFQIFQPNELIAWSLEYLSEKVRVRTSEERLIELIENPYKAKLIANKSDSVTIDEIEYEELGSELLATFGYISDEYRHNGLYFSDFIKKHAGDEETCVQLINDFLEWLDKEMASCKTIDVSQFILISTEKYGYENTRLAIEIVRHFSNKLNASTSYKNSKYSNLEPIELEELYTKEEINAKIGTFFDQRYIDFLNSRPDQMDSMNWRKFEELAAEYYKKEGYSVTLGKGRKDGGRDVYLEKDGQKVLVQCKRWENNVGINTPKIAFADYTTQKLDGAVIFCTHDVTRDGKEWIEQYQCKISVVNRKCILEILDKMSTV